MSDNYIVIQRQERPKIIKVKDGNKVFGEIYEITSRAIGAERVNVAKVILWGPDFLHFHKRAEETYICTEGAGEIFLDEEIFDFVLGTRVIIKPKVIHAARPKKDLTRLVFTCVSSPAFSYMDVVKDTRGRVW